MPPPEKPADVRRRSYIVLSMWLLVVFLGLPIWWYTTTIYRANLPVDEMLEWADGKVSEPHLDGELGKLTMLGLSPCVSPPDRRPSRPSPAIRSRATRAPDTDRPRRPQ